MISLLAILFSLLMFRPIIAEEIQNLEENFSIPSSPPQKVLSRYQTNFDFHHDRGFYLSASIGPQWIHSIAKPNSSGIRFGGKISIGWYVSDGLALIGSSWGHFLEDASLLAIGPGVAYLFNGPNIGLEFSLGIAKAFNAVSGPNINDFSETILATSFSAGKYWWLSGNTSLGVALSSGFHGLTLSKGAISSYGYNLGLNLSFLFG